ncbi:tyrosine-protein kinase family protein [Solirhodobacter olei]|uniref:tyrosine-protein kinase family protein n=1 Tax=Solirhodobacter olei TaxID=2493082 RepID=UPI000FDA1359|nr:CpsD/CapB family tyrosine-protein kinase [Solirhodobacter olei]
MERLESALAKARKQRQKAHREPEVSAEEIHLEHDWTALPSIVIKPRIADRRRLGALLGGADAAPYDILRARLLRRIQQGEWRRLVVTSPNKGCGKSTVSANLALSLTRLPDFKVILMDFDLRRPSLSTLFGNRSPYSIDELLLGRVEFQDYAVRLGENLALCTSHAPVPASAELIRSRATGDLISRLESEWKPNLIIFDTPPMLGNDDTLGFLPLADSALLIAAAGTTTLNQIDVCERELSEVTNVAGTVLNKCRYLGADDKYDSSYYY